MPPDQQGNKNYNQYGVFWLYNWFQAGNGDIERKSNKNEKLL
jgi:hypothetical protein